MNRLGCALSGRGYSMMVALGLALLMAACAGFKTYPPSPLVSGYSDRESRIGPHDRLNVVVWRHPELSATVAVRSDGRISTPLLEDLVAAGHSPAELAQAIEQRLARIVRDPGVTVVVSGSGGAPSQSVRIVGEAARPQSFPYRQDMTMHDAMRLAGGLSDEANGNGAVLVRSSEGGRHYGVRLGDLLQRHDISANVALQPGDVIIVPQSWF